MVSWARGRRAGLSARFVLALRGAAAFVFQHRMGGLKFLGDKAQKAFQRVRTHELQRCPVAFNAYEQLVDRRETALSGFEVCS